MADDSQPLVFHPPMGNNPVAAQHRADQEAGIAFWDLALRVDWPEITVAWLQERWTLPCPRCRGRAWFIGDVLVADQVWGLATVQPKVTLTCTTCGDTAYLNPFLLGIVSQRVPQGSEADETGSA